MISEEETRRKINELTTASRFAITRAAQDDLIRKAIEFGRAQVWAECAKARLTPEPPELDWQAEALRGSK